MQNPELLNIEMRATSTLTPYARNSRTHSEEQVEQIAASIREFGFTNPVLVDNNGEIIAGHGRVLASARLGLTEIPVIMLAHLTETQKRAYVIADNKIALNAGWDDEMLAAELAALDAEGYDLGVVGFSDEELAEILPDEEDEAAPGDEDALPEVEAKSVSIAGDVWNLGGGHRVMCGDSTKIDDVHNLMAQNYADQLLTDPPYNVDYQGKTKEALTIQNDKFSNSAFRQFLFDAFAAANSVMKEGASFYIWHADSEGFNFRAACQDAGWKIRQCLIWIKDSMVLGRQDYHCKHEPCLYGWKDGAAHYWASDRKQVTTINCKRPQKNTEHPTMKPVELIEYVMLNNTKAGDIVLDLFLGSGTTLIAAEKNDRICYGMEFDPKYCDVIIKRWQQYSGKTAVHAESGLTFEQVCQDRS